MAKTVTVNMVDDIDGTRADQTVKFGFDGSNYEIDLGSDNAEKLRFELTVWADAGRPAQQSMRMGEAKGQPPGPAPIDANAVRSWARRYGFEVGERGRLPLRLVEAFAAANQHAPAGLVVG